MTWSRASIAASIGSRWAAVQTSAAEVTKIIGCVPSANPCSSARVWPISWLETTKASAGRFRARSRSSNPWPT